MFKSKLAIAILSISILPFYGSAQSKTDKAPINWYNMDYKSDKIMGISTEKAYELLQGRKSTPVVVAVIDGGVDVNHEDLKDVLWINKNENKKNNKDDDNNSQYKIYPTLVKNDIINISLPEKEMLTQARIRIFDTGGAMKYQTTITGSSTVMCHLPEGNYFVSVQTDEFHKVEKIIVQQ